MKLENRIKRLEEALSVRSKPVTFTIMFFGNRDNMPVDPWLAGNMRCVPVSFGDLLPFEYNANT